MDFAEFKRRLRSSPTFRELERWTITDTDSGLTILTVQWFDHGFAGT